MAEKGSKTDPRTFFLNEKHELARGEKTSQGRTPQYVDVNWAAKGKRIRKSLNDFIQNISESRDPLRKSRYFMLARPVQNLTKASKDKIKAPSGILKETPTFSKEHSRVFHKLGIDLIDVTQEGNAIVHSKPEQVSRLIATCETLDEISTREQARWAMVDAFGLIPREYRLDEDWFGTLPATKPADVVIELQPLLDRIEVEQVIRAIHELLREHKAGEILRNGTDFSGRHWFRGNILKSGVDRVANYFSSIQSLHSPLFSIAASATTEITKSRDASEPKATRFEGVEDMPCVAIVDTGVPRDHNILAPLRRGQYLEPGALGMHAGAHGSIVASRTVFGDIDFSVGIGSTPPPSCTFYDINVAESLMRISDKSVVPGMEAVSRTAPDVRVFNLSFDHLQPLGSMLPKDKQECLWLVQDLDNFIFASDAVVVVSAGNSPEGTSPVQEYPHHFKEGPWGLGPWARSFNSITCGASVGRLSPNGLVTCLGWPSPFTRIGPGLADSPKVDFSSNGGNATASFKYSAGLGVWGINDQGDWEDHCGTSFAAPLLSREAAFASKNLHKYCQQGAIPFGATIKAFLALTASRIRAQDRITEDILKRALGRGTASAERLKRPLPTTAIMIWQGVLENLNDKAEVQIPIPLRWYRAAKKPALRLVTAWNSPANAAVHNIWACRNVTARLRARPNTHALSGSKSKSSRYPIIDRTYDLRKLPDKLEIEGDLWVIELAYDEIADYPPGMDFTPQQRVGFALELYDDDENGISPQSFIQALPIANTMTRLSVPPAIIRAPVVIRTRL